MASTNGTPSTNGTNGTNGTPAPVAYPCTVAYGADWVEVTTEEKRQPHRVSIGPLNDTDCEFVLSLRGAFPTTRRNLSRTELVRFKGIFDRQHPTNKAPATPATAPQQGKPAVQPTSTPAPVQAPVQAPVATPAVQTPLPSAIANAETRSVNRAVAGIERRTFGNGQTMDEAMANRAEKVVHEIQTQKLYLVSYDIPDGCGVANPSDWFWRLGSRYQWSQWILPEKSLRRQSFLDFLAECEAAPSVDVRGEQRRCTVDVFPQEEGTRARLLECARENLRRNVVRLHTSLIERIGSADESLKNALTALEQQERYSEGDVQRTQAKRDNAVRAILREAGEHLNAALESARTFDETDNLQDLFAALRAAIRAHATAFNQEMRLKGSKPAPQELTRL